MPRPTEKQRAQQRRGEIPGQERHLGNDGADDENKFHHRQVLRLFQRNNFCHFWAAGFCWRRTAKLAVGTIQKGGLPIENGKFFKVPNGIFEFSLKPSELAVYCCLCKFRNTKTNACFPSRKTVAELCRVSVKTVDAALKQLCALGLIQKRKRQGRKGNFYSNEYTIPNPGERV